jgi:uncharacterized membrane protein YfcA
MTIEWTIALFAAVVFLAYCVQTVAGFGSTVVCVTLGALFLPLEDVVAFAVPLSFLQTTYIVLRHHEGIQWRYLLTRVFPAMGVGMAVSFFAFRDVGASWLKIAFGVLVLLLSARELVTLLRSAKARRLPLAVSITAIFGAGVVHGVFGTGGPLLVYAVGREDFDKRQLRSTLTTVWLVFDAILTTRFALAGKYDRESLTSLALLVPALPLGIAIGELLHRKVDERRFRIGVFALLIAAAVALVARA